MTNENLHTIFYQFMLTNQLSRVRGVEEAIDRDENNPEWSHTIAEYNQQIGRRILKNQLSIEIETLRNIYAQRELYREHGKIGLAMIKSVEKYLTNYDARYPKRDKKYSGCPTFIDYIIKNNRDLFNQFESLIFSRYKATE